MKPRQIKPEATPSAKKTASSTSKSLIGSHIWGMGCARLDEQPSSVCKVAGSQRRPVSVGAFYGGNYSTIAPLHLRTVRVRSVKMRGPEWMLYQEGCKSFPVGRTSIHRCLIKVVGLVPGPQISLTPPDRRELFLALYSCRSGLRM